MIITPSSRPFAIKVLAGSSLFFALLLVIFKFRTFPPPFDFHDHPPTLPELGSDDFPPPPPPSILAPSSRPPNKFGPDSNLVFQGQPSYYGPWTITPLPPLLSTHQTYNLTFHCTYHTSDLCPPRYAIYLRGPTLLSPDPSTFFYPNPSDPRTIAIQIQIPDAGEYHLFAWPDFKDCPAWWREHLKVPFNQAQVVGTPVGLVVEGSPGSPDSEEACGLDSAENSGSSNGRWVHRGSLTPETEKTWWAGSYPADREWIYAPRSCKRTYTSIRDTINTTSITHLAVLGDSTLRGSFCRFLWPEFSPSGTSDGDCTFEDNHTTYYSQPKNGVYEKPDGGNVTLSYRFLNNGVTTAVKGFNNSFRNVSAPSHIITGAGLWLSNSPPSEYRAQITKYLETMYEAWPDAVVVWRTTMDLVPQINCYAEKHMDREIISHQDKVGVEVVKEMKKKGMKVWVVDAGAMSRGRPEVGLDGRHWVRENPEGKEIAERPKIGEVEQAVVEAVWGLVLAEDRERKRKSGGVEGMGVTVEGESNEKGSGEVKGRGRHRHGHQKNEKGGGEENAVGGKDEVGGGEVEEENNGE